MEAANCFRRSSPVERDRSRHPAKPHTASGSFLPVGGPDHQGLVEMKRLSHMVHFLGPKDENADLPLEDLLGGAHETLQVVPVDIPHKHKVENARVHAAGVVAGDEGHVQIADA